MKVIDLRPDSKLLKANFDSYKLSLEPTPILKSENISSPLKIKTEQYSLFHSTLFQLHNHLVADPWLSNTAYYVSSDYSVQKIHYESNTGKLKDPVNVYKFSPDRERIEGIYNAELKFISEKYVLLSDGTGNMQIIDTGDRQKGDVWRLIDNMQPLSEEDTSFILQDAKLKIDKGEKIIHCLLLHVDQIDDKFYHVINWITVKEETATKKWKCIEKRTLQGKGSLFYLSLDVYCQAIIYSSNHPFKYTFDSVNEIIEEIPRDDLPKDEQMEVTVYPFQWSQKGEDVTVNFNTIEGVTKDAYQVKCLQSNIEVKCDEDVLVSSDLFAEIDTDLTTWTLENNFLQLNLVKKQPELIWPYLIPSGPIETVTGDKNVLINPQPVADLNAQMEECDYGDNGQENDEYFIERVDAVSHQTTHKVFLGCNHPLFAKTLRPGFPKAIAIRNDVDCCLWLQNQITPTDEWTLKHEGTLHAFGYVQASKRERKYLMCSPDMNLSVISESCRHLFIYKNSYSTAGGLRKRTGPQLLIGQQKLVALDGTGGEIIGIHVENETVMVLTESSIVCLQMADEE